MTDDFVHLEFWKSIMKTQQSPRPSERSSARLFWLCLLSMFVIAISGCESTARNLSLNQASAREACQTFLTAWKDGKSAKSLAPQIVGSDSDWETGRTLETFEILPEERTDGANLFLTVKRTIKTQKGALLEQEVGYVVGTSPVVTVFRSDQ